MLGLKLNHVSKRGQWCYFNIGLVHPLFTSSPYGKNGRHFTNDIIKRIFMNEENFYILIKISLKFFFPKGQIDN